MKIVMIIMFYRSFLFGSGGDEFFLTASVNGGEVNTVISSFVLPNFHQLIEDFLIFNW